MKLLGILFIITFFLSPCRLLEVFEQENGVSIPTLQGLTSCSEPCWLGIEVGTTTKEQLEITLTSSNSDFTTSQIGESVFVYAIQLPGNGWWTSTTSPRGTVFVVDDIVERIDLPVNICVSEIVEVYGNPLVAVDVEPYALIYPDIGIEFWFHSDTQLTSRLILRTSELTRAISEELQLVVPWEMPDMAKSTCNDFELLNQ